MFRFICSQCLGIVVSLFNIAQFTFMIIKSIIYNIYIDSKLKCVRLDTVMILHMYTNSFNTPCKDGS